MKRWSWLMAIALTISTLSIIGCSGDDETTPTTTTTLVTNTVGGVTRTNVVVVTNAPATTTHPPITTPTVPSITSQVLLDISQNAEGGSGFGVLTQPTPQAGRVTITATWTTIDLIAGGAPININLKFEVNQGVAGAGSFINSGHPSPFIGAVDMPASLKCKIQVYNEVSDSRATVHLRAVWTPN